MALRFLLDTSACVAFLDGAETALRGRWLRTPSEDVAICTVVAAELWHGAWGSDDPVGTAATVARFLAPYQMLPFDLASAELYGELAASLQKQGRPIGVADTMIAAIARSNDLTLVTHNQRHFKRVPGLRLSAWSR